MNSAAATPEALSELVHETARTLGFELVGITPAVSPTTLDGFKHWLDAGFAGEMHYFARRQAAYDHPSGVLPTVRSVIVVGLNYFSRETPSAPSPPAPLPGVPGRGGQENAKVARYAVGTGDYHEIIRQRLQQLAAVLHEQRPGCRTRPVVDTAPLLERDFARLAGLGWFGKNTLLINKKVGSFLFLGALLTDVELAADQPHETNHCGTCTRCLDACPTDAFVAPYVLDARRCISYLTIELRDDPIPTEFRPQLGEWVYGCDVCQDVCPWNRKAPETSVPEFRPAADLAPVDLEWLLSLTEADYQARFAPTPLERARRSGLIRNAAIVAGNSGEARFIEPLRRLLEDSEPLIREAAEWGLERLTGS